MYNLARRIEANEWLIVTVEPTSRTWTSRTLPAVLLLSSGDGRCLKFVLCPTFVVSGMIVRSCAGQPHYSSPLSPPPLLIRASSSSPHVNFCHRRAPYNTLLQHEISINLGSVGTLRTYHTFFLPQRQELVRILSQPHQYH